MADICILEEFDVHKNNEILEKAEKLKPDLYRIKVKPQKVLKGGKISTFSGMVLKKDDSVILDFGDHQVGYVTLDLTSTGSHQDAPLYLYLRFAERREELDSDPDEYDGWISKGWLQQEYIHVDVLPKKLDLHRRYAFRYLEIKVIDVSLKFSLAINDVTVTAVSAVNRDQIKMLETDDSMLRKIDKVSVRTLQNCMQDVFEDGPKRDRRLWLGDLRLQARANYQTFKNYDLVKRCLYLFAGMPFNEGKISACLFLEPVPEPDDTYLFDYALLFVPALVDYYEETKDTETLSDLYPTAMRQIEIALSYLTDDNIIPDHSGEFWCFVDWGDGLNTQTASLAILIYSIRYGIRLAEYADDQEWIKMLRETEEVLKKSAVEHFWDEEQEMFVSGDERQVSWATQIWMILARVFTEKKSCDLILRTIERDPEIKMVTPYMYHHYIDALICTGEKARALDEIKRYWGGMVQEGADTFWEVYNPDNKNESPYGSVLINSYCHAWSCTPTYFLRKFYVQGD